MQRTQYTIDDFPVDSYARLVSPYSNGEEAGGIVRITEHDPEGRLMLVEHVSGPEVQTNGGRIPGRFEPVPRDEVVPRWPGDEGRTEAAPEPGVLLIPERMAFDDGPSLIERMVHLSNLHGRWQQAKADSTGADIECEAAGALIDALALEVERHGIVFRPGAGA